MKKTFKKSVSFLLVFVMVLSLFTIVPFTALAANDYTINSAVSTDNYYNLVSKKDWDIAPGITESEIVLNNDAGDHRQAIYVMEADLNNEYVKVTHSYNGMIPKYGDYKTGVMSEQAAYAEANGYGNVVGAMNTCLSWYTGYPADRVGEPLGFIMMDGEIIFDPGNCGYAYGNVGFPSVVVINKDFDENGNPRPADIPKVEMPQIRSAADLDGWEEQVIPCSSGYILKDGVNQASPSHSGVDPRSVVGIKPDGTVVIMLNDGRQAPYSTGMTMYELAEVMLDLGCSYAVNCDGGGSSTYLSQRPGEELKVNNSPSDGAERPTTTGILFYTTAPANGEFYKAHVAAENTYYTPNSTVEFEAIGTDMGGTEVEIPAEAVWQLTDPSFGTIENGVFKSNGKLGEVTVQLVYNDKVVGENTITIVIPDISFKTDTIIIGYGDTTVLPIEVTTNEGRNEVTYSEGDIVYTLSDEKLGTISGDNFTACAEDSGMTEGTVTAYICGQTDKTISAAIRFGKASEIVYDYEDGQLILDTDPEVDPPEGEPYGWFIRDTRANGYFAYRFFAKKNYTPVGMDIPARLYIADRETGKVRNGNYSMGVDIDWTNVTASCHGQTDIFFPESLDLTDATSVGFWAYIPKELVTSSMNFRGGFRKADGSMTTVDKTMKDMLVNTSGIGDGGWLYFNWEVLDNYAAFEYFQINSHYTAGAGSYNYYQDVKYYIDDITVDYSDATIDRENPYFTSMTIADDYTNGAEVSGQTITTNTITLMAQAYENTTKPNATGLDRNSVKLYVDGVLSDAEISVSAGGTITVSDLYMNDGVHTLLMEISDGQGNVGNIARKLVVNTEKSAVRLEVPAPQVDLLPTGSIYWVNVVADDLAAVDSVTTTISLDYVNDWELEGMEVAYGFEAEYYVNTHNDAVITFTRTGTEVADTDVLAKLPIRIWYAKGWLDDSGIRANYISNDPKMQDKYYILTPHAMWYSDGTRDYRLVVGAEAGNVTFTDGSTMTFSAKDTVLQTEMNRYYTNADRQGKWSFHICTEGTAQSKDATCTEAGYENRTFCVGCGCESVANLGTECYTHNGCGSVLDWGTIVPALGHEYDVVDGKLTCVNGGELFSGVYTDGKTYVDGVVVADGWNADNTSYYVDGVKLTGSHIIDKAVYTFDDNGVYMPDHIYNGFITDDGVTMYFYTNTNYEDEYLYVNDAAYYFVDGIAKEGTYTINGETCLFEGGKFISCSTADIMDAGWESMTVTYIIYSDGSMILGGEGATYKYTSRAQLPWYKFRTKVTSILIGKDITSLGHYALADIYYTKSITFEEGSKLNYIGAGTFLSCYGITEIVLPDSLQTIVQNSFKMCKNLEDVYLPAGVKYLNKLTFVNNQNVVMPKIKLHVYEGTYAADYAVQYNIPYEYRVFVDSVIASGTCGENATWEFYKSGKMVIGGSGAMDNYTGKDATPWADYLTAIKSVEIGKDITSIGNYAFAYGTDIESLTFEEGSKLEKIGAAAFLYMVYTTEVEIPDTVTLIGNLAFAYCSHLESVIVPQNVTLIYPQSFKKSASVVLNVAEGTYAESYAKTNAMAYETREFVDMVIAEGTCGANATWTLYASGTIVIGGSGAMDSYASKDVTPWADYLKQIKHIVIGKDITSVGNYAFAYATNTESLTFEEGSKLEKIGAAAFLYMVYTTEVEIPDTVTLIGNLSFAYCSRLADVVVPQNVTLIYPQSFKKSENVVLNVVEGTYGETYAKTNAMAYETREFVDMLLAEGTCGADAAWTLYASGKMVISGSGAIDNYASKDVTPWADYVKQIKEVVIGKDITVVGNYAFAYATNNKSVTFEEGSKLERIGAAAFLYNGYVTEVAIPDTVTYVGNSAFAYCSRLATVKVPASVKTMFDKTFNKSSAVTLNVAAGSYAESFATTYGIAYIVK
ncbi:MAG: leucine-rich repeat protein [Ruminococcus sp.]|nr:leucine-rich repeat protein [Ruminococcus sp.]